MLYDKYKRIYAFATVGYGVLRKIPILADAKVVNYNIDIDIDNKNIPMLMPTKALIMGFSGLSSIYLWPMWAYSDLSRVEAYIRGIPYRNYRFFGDPKNVIDYILE